MTIHRVRNGLGEGVGKNVGGVGSGTGKDRIL